MKLNVLPFFSINNARNISRSSFILPCETYQGSSRAIPSANFIDLFTRQFSSAMRFTTRATAFAFPIPIIFKLRANPQVRRVAAWRIVARMAHAQAVRNRSKMDLPSNSVRSDNFPIIKTECTVAILVATRSPRPAIVTSALLNFAPKIAQLFLGKFDFSGSVRERVRSFIHNYSMVEVRARTAANTASALVFFNPVPGACQ